MNLLSLISFINNDNSVYHEELKQSFYFDDLSPIEQLEFQDSIIEFECIDESKTTASQQLIFSPFSS